MASKGVGHKIHIIDKKIHRCLGGGTHTWGGKLTSDEPTKLRPNTKSLLSEWTQHSPLEWRDRIKTKLAKLFKEGIIEGVPTGATLTYLSPSYWVP